MSKREIVDLKCYVNRRAETKYALLIHFGEVIPEIKALGFSDGWKQYWVPKSEVEIEYDESPLRDSEWCNATITIPIWLCEKKEIDYGSLA